MAAARYDIHIEPGVPFTISFHWKTISGGSISLAGRNPYMKLARSGDIVMDSATLGGIVLTKEPTGATGRIDVLISGTNTKRLLRPFVSLGALHYVVDLLDPGDAGNTIRLINGMVILDEEYE